MQIVRDLAGYSYGRSDLVRRAMAKKKHKVMEQEREYFVHGMVDEQGKVVIPGCVRNGVDEKVADQIYDEMISFASYAFNKSHAAAYGVVCMETGWLKRHYPVQFMAAIMNSVFGNAGKIAGYIQYCRSRNVPILPPDVNASGWKFTVEKTGDGTLGILFGFGAVKNVGEGAAEAIIQERKKGAFRDIFDFCRRIDTGLVNKRVVESLIRAGAFDSMHATRPQMLAVYERAMDANAAQRKQNVNGQLSLFDMAFSGQGTGIESREELPQVPDYPAGTRLAMEKEMTGVYITGHPLDDYREKLSKLTFSTADLVGLEEREDQGLSMDGMNVVMGGILVEAKGKATKKGAYMGFVTLEDMTGQIECLVFPKVYDLYQAMLTVDATVVLTGKLSIREEEAPKLLVDSVTKLTEWQGVQSVRPRTAYTPARHQTPRVQPVTDAQLAKSAAQKLYLQLSRRQMDGALAALALHPGSVPVYLHIPEEKITLLAPKLNWCDATEACLNRMTQQLGKENVKLVEARS